MITNGDSMRGVACFLSCVGLLLLDASSVLSGNLEMVEKNVEELESLNREALKKLDGLPRNGTIDLKAYVTMEGAKAGIVVDEAHTTVKDPTGKPVRFKSTPGVEVSAPTREGKIEFLEKIPATKTTPGGSDVR